MGVPLQFAAGDEVVEAAGDLISKRLTALAAEKHANRFEFSKAGREELGRGGLIEKLARGPGNRSRSGSFGPTMQLEEQQQEDEEEVHFENSSTS